MAALIPPITCNLAPGVAVPTPTLPSLKIVKAGGVVVAVPSTVVVGKKRLPPAFLMVQWDEVREPSERESWGSVDEASCNSHLGVVVPRPRKE